MKKAILAQKVLASVLAIGLGGFVLPLAAQANSGLSDKPQEIPGFGKFYVGCNGAADNVVIIDRDLSEQADGVIGGYAESGIVTNNRLTISGGEVEYIYGGYSFNGDATGNEVNISGGELGYVYGGYAKSGIVTNNRLTISGGEVGYIYGGYSFNGDATGNKVSISGGEVGSVCGGYAFDGDTTGGNIVRISGGKVTGDVCGGRASYGLITGNEVRISGGEVGYIYGGDNIDGDTKGNIVRISGGTVTGDVKGGNVQSGTVTENRVNISGGMVKGDVYGGYAVNGNPSDNSITLSATADVSQANLYGGYSLGYNATVENNKLIINGWSGKVQSINNFNGAEGGIEVTALAGGLDLAVDKTTDFVFTENGIKNCDNLIKAENIQAGVALIVSGSIAKDDFNLNITPTSVRINDQTAITTESRAAAAAFVNQGADAVSDSINSLQGAEAGISTFATVSGNNSKYDTGSYVDINGWNGIVGVAKTKDLNAGKFSYGAFFENGGGNYNTYNDFNGTSFRGDGNVVYNGGGLLMRYEQEDGVYTEASLRAGTAKNEVSNALEFTNSRYGFKTENAYYGAHIGIGKIIKLDNGKAWDIYGKYFHTHHEGDSVKIANDVFDFDSVDSDKLRIGARFSEQQGEKLTSYYGLAWEYEFSGDAGGTANHYAMYTPSLEGSTVIGEVGFRYTPGKASPWYFDANVRGYAGMQEGISGSVQAVYSF